MGNALDSKPSSYTVQGSKMQSSYYTNTYAQRVNQPSDPTDSIPWGNQGSSVQIGLKILQDPNNSELYIMNKANQKVYITKNKQPLPNAAALCQTGKNYGRGPCMQYMGDPLNPTIYMYTGSDLTPGKNFTPIQINNMNDFKEAMTQDNSGHDINAKYSGMYGMASLSPFQPLPKDAWSAGADFNRVANKIGEQMILPAAEEVIGKVIPGFGTFMGVTGLEKSIQNDINKGFDALHKSRIYQSGSNYDTSLSNIFKDPRLTSTYTSTQQENTQLGEAMKQSTNPNVMRMPSQTPQEMILKARALQQENNSMSVKQQTQDLEGAMNKMKAALGNKVDWSYYNQMQYGLAASTNYEASINILTHFATKLNSEVIPIYKAHLNNQTIQVPHDTSTPPKGGGFQAIPWHPRVINGNYYHPMHKMTIRG